MTLNLRILSSERGTAAGTPVVYHEYLTFRTSERMGTTTIEARCNARPTRLAFILPRPDRDLLLNVISRATTLWGGIFNPIIILDDATRVARGVHYEMLPPQPYLERQGDILRSFDPDILVNYSDDPLPEALKHFQHAHTRLPVSIGIRGAGRRCPTSWMFIPSSMNYGTVSSKEIRVRGLSCVFLRRLHRKGRSSSPRAMACIRMRIPTSF